MTSDFFNFTWTLANKSTMNLQSFSVQGKTLVQGS